MAHTDAVASMLAISEQLRKQQQLFASRILADGATAQELAAQSQLEEASSAALQNVYRFPLRNGLDALPDVDADELSAFILDDFAQNEASTSTLQQTIRRSAIAFGNIGGALALSLMGISATFVLSNDDILQQLSAYAANITSATSTPSLIRTTADDLSVQVVNGRLNGLSLAEQEANIATYVTARSRTRSRLIALDQRVTHTRTLMTITYEQNDVQRVYHRTAPEMTQEGPCPICAPLDGQVFNIISGVVVGSDIPLHIGCVCYHDPVLSEWEQPETVWTGG